MKNSRKARKSWFVIIIGDKKRHQPFEVTQRALIVSALCLIGVLAVISAGSSWLFSRPYIVSNSRLTEKLATARQSITVMTRENENCSEEIETLRAQLETPREKRKTPVSEKETKKNTVAVVKGDAAVETKPFVSLEGIQIVYDTDKERLKVRFIIANQAPGDGYISGYVFVILNPAPGSSALHKSSPVTELAGGLPRFYNRGEDFTIARFKHIEGIFPSISDRSRYSSLSVLVYADDGKLRLKKELSL